MDQRAGRSDRDSGSSPMDQRRRWVTRKAVSIFRVGIGVAGTVLMLVVAVTSFLGGQPVAGGFALLGGIIVGTQSWRGKLSYDLARSELKKFPE